MKASLNDGKYSEIWRLSGLYWNKNNAIAYAQSETVKALWRRHKQFSKIIPSKQMQEQWRYFRNSGPPDPLGNSPPKKSR